MYRLGVVAMEGERNLPRRKWYEFWKRYDDVDFFVSKDEKIEYTALYMPENAAKRDKWKKRAEDYFRDEGIYDAVKTRSVDTELCFSAVQVHDGRELTYRMIPEILGKICKYNCKDTQVATVAYADCSFDRVYMPVLEKICKSSRHLIIVTDTAEKASGIEQTLYNKYGAAVQTVFGEEQKVDCDYLIMVSGRMPKVSRDTVVLDLNDSGFYQDRVTINSVDIRGIESYSDTMPYKFVNLELAQALVAINAVTIDEVRGCKISGLYYNGNAVYFGLKT